jgi:dihydropyrimidinase
VFPCSVIEHLQSKSLTAPAFHAVARPPIVETEATQRALCLAALTACPVLFVHVSSAAAMSAIRAAQTEGQPVYAETCPQYLLLLAEAMRPLPHSGGCCGNRIPLKPNNYIDESEEGYEGAKLICSPPLRENKSDLDAVWKGVKNGTVTVISSDHAPGKYDHTMGKKKGKKGEHGGMDFTRTPNGLPGLETRLPLLMSYGVEQRRSEWSYFEEENNFSGCSSRLFSFSPVRAQRFVEICCSQPARLYGLQDRKGEIAPGMDADIVIWYPPGRCTVNSITNDMLHHDIGK